MDAGVLGTRTSTTMQETMYAHLSPNRSDIGEKMKTDCTIQIKTDMVGTVSMLGGSWFSHVGFLSKNETNTH